MNAKEILDTVKLIVKRQDFDRTLALFLLNTSIKDLVRNYRLYGFDEVKSLTYDTYGKISAKANNIKNIIDVEWINTSEERRLLQRVKHYEAARMNFDFTDTGEPIAYVVYGDTIKILPTPTEGTIEVFAEYYPDNLLDSVSSSNTITENIGNCLSFLVSAEYFDMLQEETRGKYWKEKGLILLKEYISYIKNRELQNLDPLARNPFGNAPIKWDSNYEKDVADYDMGTF